MQFCVAPGRPARDDAGAVYAQGEDGPELEVVEGIPTEDTCGAVGANDSE